MKFLKELLGLENDVDPPYGDDNPQTIYTSYSFPHDKWKAAFVELQEAQPMFFAHRFDEASDIIPEEALPGHTIIPISFDLEKDIRGVGAYSEVFGIKIHPGHHTFTKVRAFVTIVLTSILTNRYRRRGITTLP